jgi:nucleoside-diphosphate-sugar epimerase
MERVLVTGASGFIGKALCRCLLDKGFAVTAVFRTELAYRKFKAEFNSTSELFSYKITGQVENNINWSSLFENINSIVHLAARVHVTNETARDPLTEFRKINVIATENIANAAAQAGVKRFVFLSSIGVNGQVTPYGVAFTEADTPNPQTYYAQTKWEAEQKLRAIEKNTGLKVVNIRSPLVYGYGGKGNFTSLLQAVKRGIPLPLKSINNQRSFIYLGNLCDAIVTCVTHEKAAGNTYVVCDKEIVSTPGLISLLAEVMGKSPRLLPFPPYVMYLAANILKKTAIIERLTGSLTVDSSKIAREIHWYPPYSLYEGLQRDFSQFKG